MQSTYENNVIALGFFRSSFRAGSSLYAFAERNKKSVFGCLNLRVAVKADIKVESFIKCSFILRQYLPQQISGNKFELSVYLNTYVS